jgi:hypothetical protein
MRAERAWKQDKATPVQTSLDLRTPMATNDDASGNTVVLETAGPHQHQSAAADARKESERKAKSRQ